MHTITRRSQLYGLGAQTSAAGTLIDAVRSVASGAGSIAADQIHGVTIRSQLSPDIELTGAQALGSEPAPGGMGELFFQIAKPAIYVETSLGTIRLAPWGEPSMNLYPVFMIGLLVAGATVAGLVVRGLKK
jgi:hypothetical protein